MAEVICYGSISIDEILWLSHWPSAGEALRALAEKVGLGGSAANCAFTLAEWGYSVALGGNTLGDDLRGRLIAERLAERGIDGSALALARGKRTGSSTILVSPSGSRTIIGRSWDAEDAGPMPSMYGGRCLTLDRYLPGRLEAARLARQLGLLVVACDLSDPDDELVGFCDAVILSSRTMHAEVPNHDLLGYAWRLLERGPRYVAITDGPRPATFVTGEQRYSATPPSLCIYDTTGAGDSFRAGMIHGLLVGLEHEPLLAFAVAAGTLRCLRPGAAEDPPRLAEVQALASEVAIARVA